MSGTTPPFSRLPLDPSGPPGNAWGLFGPSNDIGMLNLLTPAVVAAAAKTITSGVRISLDWPLDKPLYPSYGRVGFKHEISRRGLEGRPVNDDVLVFNTQSSSQWDGFRHYGYVKEQRYYNGYTNADVKSSSALGIDAWANSGGIVGRGVLLDYASWAARNEISINAFTSQRILLSHLKALTSEQNITFQSGDILFIRSGFTIAFDKLLPEEQRALPERPVAEFIGVESTKELLEWLWENQFAAVAGDAPAFESSPVGGKECDPDVVLHQWLLGGWGMPIGEMFDLERLSEHCRETGRWEFFLSSVPLKVPKGVASPPNAVAIF